MEEPISSCSKGNKLLKYIDGTALCPEKFLKKKNGISSSIVNAAYELWVKPDALVLLWINVTLTLQVLQRVVGLQSAHEVWQQLEKLHLIQSRSKVWQLKQ